MAFWDFITDALSYLGESQLEVTESERQMQEELAVLVNNKITEWDNEGAGTEIPAGLKESADAVTAGASGANGIEIDPNEFINQFGEPIEGPKDPKGSTRSLVTDSYLMATMNPSTWLQSDSMPDLKLNPYRLGNRQAQEGDMNYTGMMGTDEIEFYEQSYRGQGVRRRSWEPDTTMMGDGFGAWQRQTVEDVPFTISDAMGIFDAQSPEKQQQIAEGLALGSDGTNWMYRAVGDSMFTDPDMIYNRESVRQAFIGMGEVASGVAGTLQGGFQELGNEFIPDLEPNITVGQFTDNIFDAAINAGAIKRMDPLYIQNRGEAILPALTGLRATPEYLKLVSGWAEEFQLQNIGGNPYTNESRLDSFIVDKTRDEYPDELSQNRTNDNASSLMRAFGIE